MSNHPAATAHGPIAEIFPDLYWVQGSIKMKPGLVINRNMTIVRDNGELTLITPVRLNAETEAALTALGTIRHVIRIGTLHGKDDAYYVERFGAEFWCQPGKGRYSSPTPTQTLTDGGALPFSAGQVFTFTQTKEPEAALLLERHGGVLITCDSLQHWADRGQCSLLAKVMLPILGFKPTTVIGGPWLKAMTPAGGSLREDFERLLTWTFKHHIAAHGGPCLNDAHERARLAVSARYP